ncbi:hypothetical protein TI39_contig5875g00007 [Zymoseptoria brevis]|uniref:Uncharacterized protein n=1 Tax=Zymoseptoria brevis TaxID=1047168 RepID=A0A0F4G5H0_9PEZI|nr:hypothetical protein TI39_contig5875g00007 [Zymoseptoria brevis]
MSVPEFVRRKFGTMFSCHPPFALETAASTFDSTATFFRSQTPPISSYHEYPIHSLSAELARRNSAAELASPSRDAVAENKFKDEFRKEEVAAALLSSPPLTAMAPYGREDVEGGKTIWGDEYHDDEEGEAGLARHPYLPDLVPETANHSSTSPPLSSPAVSHHEAITPSDERTHPFLAHHDAKALKCPHCGVRLTVIVEEDGEIEEKSVCACEEKIEIEDGKSMWAGGERNGPVQVLRGAW